MSDDLFLKIIDRKIPADIVYETDDVLAFRDAIMKHVVDSLDGKLYDYSQDDLQEIDRLREERFSTWDWNFAYSPKYAFRKEMVLRKGRTSVEMKVVNGKIEELFIQSDFLGRTDTTILEKMMTGVRHDPLFIEEKNPEPCVPAKSFESILEIEPTPALKSSEPLRAQLPPLMFFL